MMMYGMALCAGVGGIELGLRLAESEYRTICYVEREAYASALLVQRMVLERDRTSSNVRDDVEVTFLDEAPVWDDIRSFDGKPWRGKVDVITSGFPCQPWSVAGKRKGTEDERWIWNDILRVVCEVRPRFVFLENVPGLVTGGGLQLILGDLAKAGYNAEWMSLSAAEVGANHKRGRIWILAYFNSRQHKWENQEIQTRGNSANSCGKNMAHSDTRWELQQEGRECDIRRRAGNSSEDVANPSSRRLQGSQQGDIGISGTSQKEGSSQTDRIKGRSCVMADSSKWREEYAEDRETNGNGPSGETGRCSCNKGDAEDSRCSLRQGGIIRGEDEVEGGKQDADFFERPSWWAVEPPLGRVAHGITNRVDRLRACGNSVVPLVAATAWRILRARAEGMNPSPYNLSTESRGGKM